MACPLIAPKNDAPPPDVLLIPLEAPTAVTSEVATIAVMGEIDICTVGILDQQVTRALGHYPQRLVIDLTGVRFMGAVGVNALIQARVRASAQSCQVYLRGTKPAVARTLRSLSATELFTTL